MKKFLALIALVLPMMASAGPEDHTPGAVYQATTPVPYYLTELVFDQAQLSQDENTIVLSARYGNFFGDFKVIKASRMNEDKVRVTAQKTILNKWQSGCGDGEVAVATIEAIVHNGYGIDPKDMKISVEYTLTNDTCHSQPQTQVIEYVLAK